MIASYIMKGKIQQKNNINKAVIELYDRLATNNVIGLHLGYHEKGIRTYEESIINMNNFVGKLLDLDSLATKKSIILDVGCGTGSTSLYLAKRYPNIDFLGITLAPKEIEMAITAQKEKHIKNTKFILGDYNEIRLPDNSFDGIFVLESLCYAEDKKNVLKKFYKILKPNAKLVVIDTFLTGKSLTYFVRKAYDFDCTRAALPPMKKIDDFKLYLKEVGFNKIKTKDITKNIRWSFFIMSFISFIGFLKRMKYMKPKARYITKSIFLHFIMMIFSPFFISLSRTSKNMAITAVKKENY
jgi:tocopherol O-methyltransferase